MFRIFGGKKAKVEEKASQAAAQAAKDAPKPQPQKAESKPPVETPKVEFNFRKDFTQIYSLGRKIAEGSFGSAHVCLDIETNQQYAAKVIYKKTLTSQPSIDDVNREERILRTLGAGSHRNFIDFYGAFEDDVKVIFVLEFCTGGELLDMILMKKQHSEKHARDVIRQILQVVAHCHLKGVIHRDIKPQNFLLANISSDSPLKIIDFGLSDFFGPDTVFRQPVGTTLYAAPELLQRSYGPLADLWSVGVISYILLSGEPPFWANTETGVFRQILRGHLKLEGGVWDRISTEAKDFIRGLLDRNPETRLTAAGALSHPWLTMESAAQDVPLDYKVLTSMKDFAKQSKVRQMFMFRVAETFMDDEIKDLRDQFSAMDQDNDGCISIAEMAEALRSMRTGEASTQSINEDQIEEILKGMDVDGNGLIDYSEFVAATLQLSRIHRGDEEDWNQRTLQIFESIDRDNSGFIDPVELAHALGYGEDVEDVIREADTNEDGVIDYEEFSMLMRKVTGGKSASEQ